MQSADGCALCTGLITVSTRLEDVQDTQGRDPPQKFSSHPRSQNAKENLGIALFLGGREGSEPDIRQILPSGNQILAAQACPASCSLAEDRAQRQEN